MGVYLAKPKTQKISEDGGEEGRTITSFGAASMQGWRQTMEDAHIAKPSLRKHSPPTAAKTVEELACQASADGAKDAEKSLPDFAEDMSLYAVFDGHASNAVSCWVSEHYVKVFLDRLEKIQNEARQGSSPAGLAESLSRDLPDASVFSLRNAILCEALQQSFLDVDEQMQKEENRKELKKYFEAGQLEQRDNETYIQRYLNDGGDVRLVEMDGQKYLQFVPRNSEDDEEGEGAAGSPGTGEEAEEGAEKKVEEKEDARETSASSPAASVNGGEAEAKSAAAENADAPSDAQSVSHLTRFNSTDEFKDEDDFAGAAQEGDAEKKEKEEAKEDEEDKDDDDKAGERPLFAHPSTPEGSGATAVVVLVVGGEDPVIITANAGDSRGVICRGGKAFPLSHDHKPTNPDEKKRIFAAGGYVTNGRVDGNLNLSRAVGDLFYKQNKELPAKDQRITAYPDVRITRISPEDEFVILACDGIWDGKTNQEAVDFVREKLRAAGDTSSATLKKICEDLCDECLAEDPLQSEGHGCDNMTCLVVELSSVLKRGKKTAAEEEHIVLYGGIEDKYLGRDEKQFESDDNDD
ncbi:protein phosphatase 2C domain-containing protein [Besnoitia besnoiti]|uniref:protein-serine/threonine phosphatase n=1 Tax=Besnoitia besnoiti TaxID=94643 RepID=A0A2A9MQM4_BESBE|nr:protein phosphatase 2C domain-containing protein [Besnoitia besnoiti]PFH38577.1 protein phosphatase 2C domain-containing protein [Besnoitia besnoiti]